MYTPTTDEVRRTYVLADDHADTVGAEGEFNRWLAEMLSEAWRQGRCDGYDGAEYGAPTINPYEED